MSNTDTTSNLRLQQRTARINAATERRHSKTFTVSTQVEFTVIADDADEAIERLEDHGPSYDTEGRVEFVGRSDYEVAAEHGRRFTIVTQAELSVAAQDQAQAVARACENGPTFECESGFGVSTVGYSEYEAAA